MGQGIDRRGRRGEGHWATVGVAAAVAFTVALTAPGPLPRAAAEPPAAGDGTSEAARKAPEAEEVVKEAVEAIDAAASWIASAVGELTEEIRASKPAAAPTGVRVARLVEVGSGKADSGKADAGEQGDAAAMAVEWVDIAEAGAMPERLVLLVHGLDEPGTIWDEMTPALLGEGLEVARFDYPNDQRIADSADLMAEHLRDLASRGVKRVDIVAHSMGGLVSRDVLTRQAHYAGEAAAHDGLPDVGRLIMIGTPNEGSPWASLQILSETREQLARWVDSGAMNLGALLDFSADGDGEAAEDLKPGSAFLKDLNAREAPEGVEITCIRAAIAPEEASALKEVLSWPVSRQFLTPEQIEDLEAGGEELLKALGDGVVPHDSAVLEGAEVVDVEANHRSVLLRGVLNDARRALGKDEKVAPAIPVVIDRLTEGEGDAGETEKGE